jgi:hypothetical protein
MQQQIVLNSDKLRSISHASHTAEVTITALAVRERLRHFSDITRTKNTLIRKGEKIVESDYLAFWKGLQEAGVGVIVYGRKGRPDRFEWHYSMKKVAEAALEGKDIMAERVSKDMPVSRQTQAKAAASRSKQVIPIRTRKAVAVAATASPAKSERFIYIPLRKDYSLEFSVPANLSKDEVETISNALRRLSA